MLEKIRKAIRRSDTTFDEEIQNCIDYVERDLYDQGATGWDESNPRLINLATLYTKYVFNYENRGEFYLKEYERLRNQISLQKGYN